MHSGTGGICLLLIACAAIGTLAHPGQGNAQPAIKSEITIRGFRFEPVALEEANEVELAAMGIDPDWRAALPPDATAARWRFLQFSRPLDRQTRRQLRSDGLRLELYVDGSYLEKVTDDEVNALKRSRLLLVAPLYFPEFKVAPSLQGANLGRARDFRSEQLRKVQGLLLRVTLFPGEEIDAVTALLRAAGAEDVLLQDSRRVGGRARFQVRLAQEGAELENAIRAISRIEAIRSIEEVSEVILQNAATAARNQSGDSTDASIWTKEIYGDGQIISIIDGGLPDTQHCLLADPEVPGNLPGTDHRNIRATYDDPQSYSEDGRWHATFVAASAAGNHLDSGEPHPQRGGAWLARLSLSSLYRFANVDKPTSDLRSELDTASTHAYIHSNSWHEDAGYSEWAVEFDDFSFENEDHLIIAAAGKCRPLSCTWGAPAIAKNALTVSAATADKTDVCDVYGIPTPSGRQKPDLAAVGDGIFSAVPGGTLCDVAAGACATSFATPHAAALAALAREYFAKGWYSDGPSEPSGALIKATLINAAQNIAAIPGFPNEREGWGVVTLDRTLSFADDDHKLWVRDIRNTDAGTFDVGSQPGEYELDVASNTVPLRVTLVWTDPPAGDGSDSLVNDLDLEVIAPDGNTSYLGNVFNSVTNESETGGIADDINNVEQVLIGTPATGTWTVLVRAHTLGILPANVIGQGYALVVTAGLGKAKPLSPVLAVAP